LFRLFEVMVFALIKYYGGREFLCLPKRIFAGDGENKEARLFLGYL
jgi:hypothetical protein